MVCQKAKESLSLSFSMEFFVTSRQIWQCSNALSSRWYLSCLRAITCPALPMAWLVLERRTLCLELMEATPKKLLTNLKLTLLRTWDCATWPSRTYSIKCYWSKMNSHIPSAWATLSFTTRKSETYWPTWRDMRVVVTSKRTSRSCWTRITFWRRREGRWIKIRLSIWPSKTCRRIALLRISK